MARKPYLRKDHFSGGRPQNAQNRDNRAVQAKLDEPILASNGDNRFVGAENLDEGELVRLLQRLLDQAGTTEEESPCDEPDDSMVERHERYQAIFSVAADGPLLSSGTIVRKSHAVGKPDVRLPLWIWAFLNQSFRVCIAKSTIAE